MRVSNLRHIGKNLTFYFTKILDHMQLLTANVIAREFTHKDTYNRMSLM